MPAFGCFVLINISRLEACRKMQKWWSPRHLEVTWDSFTIALLWRFKPEDCAILPIVDDCEEELNQKLSFLNASSDESLFGQCSICL